MSAAPDPVAARMKREEKERLQQKRHEWERLFAEWLVRAKSVSGDVQSDKEMQAQLDRADELARLITTTPAVFPWMIMHKLEVLEHYLGADGTNWTGNREIVMLAGIKADLLRFEPGEPQNE